MHSLFVRGSSGKYASQICLCNYRYIFSGSCKRGFHMGSKKSGYDFGVEKSDLDNIRRNVSLWLTNGKRVLADVARDELRVWGVHCYYPGFGFWSFFVPLYQNEDRSTGLH